MGIGERDWDWWWWWEDVLGWMGVACDMGLVIVS